MNRRRLLLLLLATTAGYGLHIVWERQPKLRFASKLTARVLANAASAATNTAQPDADAFSLPAAMAAADPVGALRAWREKIGALPPAEREKRLRAPMIVDASSLAQLASRLGTDPAMREEASQWVTLLSGAGINLRDEREWVNAMTSLAEVDPELAIDGAEALGHEGVTRAVWSVLAQEQPELALARATKGELDSLSHGAALAAFAMMQPKLAFEHAMAQAPDARPDLLAAVASAMQPAAAFALSADAEWQRAVIEGAPITALGDLAVELAKLPAEARAALAPAMTERLARDARAEPELTIAWIAEHPDAVAGKLAATERPFATLEAVKSWPAEMGARDEVLVTGLTHLVQQDATTALAWMQANTVPRGVEKLFSLTPPEEVTQLQQRIAEFPAGPDRDRLNAALAVRMADTDAAAALQFAEANVPPAERSEWWPAVLVRLLKTDAAAAAANVAAAGAEERRALADRDGLKFADGVSLGLWPEMVAKLETHKGLVLHYEVELARLAESSGQPALALQLVATLPDPALRDRLLEYHLKRNVGRNDADVVAQVLQKVADPQRREQLAQRWVEHAYFTR